jgi:hypothetical protein
MKNLAAANADTAEYAAADATEDAAADAADDINISRHKNFEDPMLSAQTGFLINTLYVLLSNIPSQPFSLPSACL